LIVFLTNNPSIQEVLLFPQMRPQVHAVKVQLTENEKAIFDIVESNENMDLNTLKAKAGLSGKQWDVSIKSLTKQGLLKVTKIGDELTVELV
jgi:lysyl-tRNA synthetase class 2